MKTLRDAGVPTYVFLGPIMTGITDLVVEDLVRKTAEAGAGFIMADKMHARNRKKQVLSSFMDVEKTHWTERKIQDLCKQYGVEFKWAFPEGKLASP